MSLNKFSLIDGDRAICHLEVNSVYYIDIEWGVDFPVIFTVLNEDSFCVQINGKI